MSGQRGFTLMEIVVGLAIAAVIVTAAAAALATVADVRARSRAASARVVAPTAARATLEHWLRGMTLLPGTEPFLGRPSAPASDVAALAFCVADGGALWPGPHCIAVRVDLDPGTAEAGLVADVRRLRRATLYAPETVSLAAWPVGVRLRYLVRLEGRARWLDSWESADQLPEAVRLEVQGMERVRLGDVVAAADVWSLPVVVAPEAAIW